MGTYILGALLAVLAGITNFTGPLLQKKAINDLKKEKDQLFMKDLFKKPIWVIGLLLICVVNVILIALAQSLIGAALIPGLTASGFIVLAFGSVKILGEELNKQEYVALGILIIGVILISASKLSIVGDLGRFQNPNFVVRIAIFSLMFLLLWWGLYLGGKKSKRNKAVFMSLGIGFPFILSNVWVQPLLLSLTSLLSEGFVYLTLIVFLPALSLVLFANIFGIIHMQHTMAEANASIVIPLQQVPQQISPIIIYFLIYALPAPSVWSYLFLISGMSLVTGAGFILSKRQAKLDALEVSA